MVAVEIDRAAQAELTRAINRTAAVGRKTLHGALMVGAVMFCKSGRKIAGEARSRKKFRKIVKNPEYTRSNGKPHWAVMTFPGVGGPAKAIPIGGAWGFHKTKPAARMVPQAYIKWRGLAEQSFGWMIKRLRTKSKLPKNLKRHHSWSSWVRKNLRGSAPSVTLANRLAYVEKAFPGIVGRAMHKAAKWMMWNANNHVYPQMKKAWSR